MDEKMRQHQNAKVHFYLLLFLSCCAEGDNAGIMSDGYLLEVLNELSISEIREFKSFAQHSLNKLHTRIRD
jgi:hypothetical protein